MPDVKLGLYYDRRSQTWKWYSLSRNKFASVDEVYRVLKDEYGFPSRLAKLLANTTHVSVNIDPSLKKVPVGGRTLLELKSSYVNHLRTTQRILRDFFAGKGVGELVNAVEFLKSSLKTRKRGYGRSAHKVDEGALDFVILSGFDRRVGRVLESLSENERKRIIVSDGRVLIPTKLARKLFNDDYLNRNAIRYVLGVDKGLMEELLGFELPETDDLRKALSEVLKRAKKLVIRSIVRRKRDKVARAHPLLFRYVFSIDFTKARIVDQRRFERAMNNLLPEYNFYGELENPFASTFAFRSLDFTKPVSPSFAKRVIQQYYLNVWGLYVPFDAIMLDESGFGLAQEVEVGESRAKWVYDVDEKRLIRVI